MPRHQPLADEEGEPNRQLPQAPGLHHEQSGEVVLRRVVLAIEHSRQYLRVRTPIFGRVLPLHPSQDEVGDTDADADGDRRDDRRVSRRREGRVAVRSG